MKNFLTYWETEEKNRKIIDKVIDRKVVNKKPPNPVKILRRKPDALYVRPWLRKIGLKDEVEAQKIGILIDRHFDK